MPSQSLSNAYIHTGTWDDSLREHPVMKWMEDYTRNIIDAQKWDVPLHEFHVRLPLFQPSPHIKPLTVV